MLLGYVSTEVLLEWRLNCLTSMVKTPKFETATESQVSTRDVWRVSRYFTPYPGSGVGQDRGNTSEVVHITKEWRERACIIYQYYFYVSYSFFPSHIQLIKSYQPVRDAFLYCLLSK